MNPQNENPQSLALKECVLEGEITLTKTKPLSIEMAARDIFKHAQAKAIAYLEACDPLPTWETIQPEIRETFMRIAMAVENARIFIDDQIKTSRINHPILRAAVCYQANHAISNPPNPALN